MTYIWPMKTVYAVKRLHAAIFIDRLMLERDEEMVLDEARRQLTKQIVRMAEPLAAVPHPSDMQFQYVEYPDPFRVKIECAWRPATQAAEMVGGPADGKVYALQRIGEAFRVATLAPVRFTRDESPIATLSTNTVTYDLVGWHEEKRHWVYSL